MDPLFTGPLVALHPISAGLAHAKSTVLVVGVVFEALDAEDVAALHTILLRFELGTAHPAFQTVLAGVLVFFVGLFRQSLQLAADWMVHILAGEAADEVVFHSHLTLHAGRTLATVP